MDWSTSERAHIGIPAETWIAPGGLVTTASLFVCAGFIARDEASAEAEGEEAKMRVLVWVAFFLSGMSSLILENLWVRRLSLVFGGTTLAIVTVLTVFMGGLALGSRWAGRFADRLKRPVFVYGVLETCIGIYALCVPWLIAQLPMLYAWLPETWPFWAFALFRFLCCVVVLLVPTTLMGATLPILSVYLVREPETVGTDVGRLYSVNTWGAVFGAAAGGFLLLPLLGLASSLWWVAGSVVVMGVLVCLLGRRLPVASSYAATQSAEDSSEPWPEDWIDEGERDFWTERDVESSSSLGELSHATLMAAWSPTERKRVSIAAWLCLGVTGGTAMMCQVLWSRAVAQVIGSSTYAFTLILCVFLVGLAGGAALGSWLVRSVMDRRWCWIHLLWGTALCVGIGTFFFDQLPLLFVWWALGLPKNVSAMGLFALKVSIASIPMLLPTVLMGTFFPLALSLGSESESKVGERVGRLYAINTVGAIVGSVGAGFVIVPWLGVQRGLMLCALLYLVCALGLVWAVDGLGRWQVQAPLLAMALGIALIPAWDTGHMGLGSFRLSQLRNSSYWDAIRSAPVMFYRDGISATVSVEGRGPYRVLKVNGKPDASTTGDRSTQIGVALLPMLVHPAPKDVAIVGWGSGMTVGTALHFPLRRLTAIELEPAVVAASRLFEPWNFYPLRDKRLQLLYNDGRNYLATTQKKFDVLISQPSNPWVSGVSNLFTKEYFAMARKRLRADGLFCQWAQLYEISTTNVYRILKALRSEFRYTHIYEVEPGSTDILVLASSRPIRLPMARVTTLLRQKKMKKLFHHMGVFAPQDLLPRFLADGRGLQTILAGQKAEANTDQHNRLEFSAPLELVQASTDKNASRFQKIVEPFRRRVLAWSQPSLASMSKPQRLVFWREMSMTALRYGRTNDARHALKRVRVLSQGKLSMWQEWRLLKLMEGKEEEPSLPRSFPTIPKAKRALRLAQTRLYLKARVTYAKSEYSEALTTFRGLSKDPFFVRMFPQIWFYLGSCLWQSEESRKAVAAFERYIAVQAAPGRIP